MAIFLPDTSVIVASLQDWHDHYAEADRELNRRLDAGDEMIVAGHSLAESYSALTRTPPPYRVPAAHALAALREGFIAGRRIVTLDPEAYVSLLEDAAERLVAGGSIYDAIIGACAARRRADVADV